MDHIRIAKDIFGESLECLKGKSVIPKGMTTRNTPVTLTNDFKRHKLVIIAIDVMHGNDIMFLVSLSNDILFGTTEHIQIKQFPL